MRRVVIVLLVVWGAASAQEIAPLLPEAYLLRPVGARATAMAGVQAACADDPTTLFSNPALMSYLIDSTAITSGTTLLSFGRSLSNLAATVPIGGGLNLAAGVLAMNAGTITRRTSDGTPLGTTSVWHGAVAASGSYLLTTSTSIGLTARYLFATAPTPASNGSGFAIDAGIVTSLLDRATVGVAINNLGAMNFGAERFSLPWLLRLGASTMIPFREEVTAITSPTLGTADTVTIPSAERLIFSIEAQLIAQAKHPTILAAAELIPLRYIALRGGVALYGYDGSQVRLLPGTALCGGVSLLLPIELPLRFDYAMSKSFTAPLVHSVSLVLQL